MQNIPQDTTSARNFELPRLSCRYDTIPRGRVHSPSTPLVRGDIPPRPSARGADLRRLFHGGGPHFPLPGRSSAMTSPRVRLRRWVSTPLSLRTTRPWLHTPAAVSSGADLRGLPANAAAISPRASPSVPRARPAMLCLRQYTSIPPSLRTACLSVHTSAAVREGRCPSPR